MDSAAQELPLRDIHLPEPVSWWPLAPGWWLLLGLCIGLLALAVFLYRRFREKRRSPTRLARQTLEQIRHDYERSNDRQQLIRELSGLLRRTAVSVQQREDVASITGEEWLRFLDTPMNDHPFSQGAGRILESGPYQRHSDVDPEALLNLCEAWLTNVERNKAA